MVIYVDKQDLGNSTSFIVVTQKMFFFCYF